MVIWLHYLRVIYWQDTLLCKHLSKTGSFDPLSASSIPQVNACRPEGPDKFHAAKEPFSPSELAIAEVAPLFQAKRRAQIKDPELTETSGLDIDSGQLLCLASLTQ